MDWWHRVSMTLCLVAIVVMSLMAGNAMAQDNPAEFFSRDRAKNWTGPLVNSNPYGIVPKTVARSIRADRQWVANIVATQAEQKLGRQWVATALKLAKIESGFNPRARNKSGASGVLQVMPRTAVGMGYDPRRLLEPKYGTAAGIEHMRRCIAAGVKTHAQMAACHVAGFAGWNKRLARKPERYKQQYIRLAMR